MRVVPDSWLRWADRTGVELAIKVVHWLMRKHHGWIQWEPNALPWCARCRDGYPCRELNRLDADLDDLKRRLEALP